MGPSLIPERFKTPLKTTVPTVKTIIITSLLGLIAWNSFWNKLQTVNNRSHPSSLPDCYPGGRKCCSKQKFCKVQSYPSVQSSPIWWYQWSSMSQTTQLIWHWCLLWNLLHQDITMKTLIGRNWTTLTPDMPFQIKSLYLTPTSYQ